MSITRPSVVAVAVRFIDLSTLESVLVPDINEYFLLHGTKQDTVDVIANQGLDSRLATSQYFGNGIYYAESSTKSDQYAGWSIWLSISAVVTIRISML